jgi:hypothetical protein
VTPGSPTHLASAALQLLVDGVDPLLSDAQWDDGVAVLERNAVLLRVADGLLALGRPLPSAMAAAAERARTRAEQVLHLMRRAGDACEQHGIPYVFPKGLPHYPDVGGDVDLLVPRSTHVDPLIVADLGATLRGPGMGHAVSGSRVYHLAGPPPGLDLDILHGRVGRLGEHPALAARLVQHRRRVVVAGATWWVPALEDALVLQGFDRLAGRRSFRIADVVSTINAVRGGLDWDAVRGAASALGVLPGVSCYLSYVSQIHREALGRELALPPLGLPRVSGWGRAEFERGAFHFPAVRVNGELYARAFGSAVACGRWFDVGRLLLLPIIAATVLARRATRALAAGVLHPALQRSKS